MKQRKENIANGTIGSSNKPLTTDAEDCDEYDKLFAALVWQPSSLRSSDAIKTEKWASLTDRCIQVIVDHFGEFDRIKELDFDSRAKLAKFLAK